VRKNTVFLLFLKYLFFGISSKRSNFIYIIHAYFMKKQANFTELKVKVAKLQEQIGNSLFLNLLIASF